MSKITLSDDTLTILGNFATINNSMRFLPGKTQAVKETESSILAIADIAEEIPREANIYDLRTLLQLIKSMKNPEIEFGSANLSIISGGASATYHYCDPKLVKEPRTGYEYKSIFDCQFATRDILKTANILSLPNIQFICKGREVFLRAMDPENQTQNDYSVLVAEFGTPRPAFNILFKREFLDLMIPGQYNVSIANNKKFAHFRRIGEGVRLEYYIVLCTNSSFAAE